jgi:hypothetical protein
VLPADVFLLTPLLVFKFTLAVALNPSGKVNEKLWAEQVTVSLASRMQDAGLRKVIIYCKK